MRARKSLETMLVVFGSGMVEAIAANNLSKGMHVWVQTMNEWIIDKESKKIKNQIPLYSFQVQEENLLQKIHADPYNTTYSCCIARYTNL